MTSLIADLVPTGLDPTVAALLLLVSFFTSAITAAFGLGGGLVLLTVMALVLPFSILIPVHGAIQLGSNAGRTFVLRRHIMWRVATPFIVGGLVGASLGGLSFQNLDETLLRVGLSLFILFLIWGPKLPKFADSKYIHFGGGAVSSFLTMFLGATGIFVGALIRNSAPDRFTMTATQATCMTVQHTLKVLVFLLLGFALSAWLIFILAMIATGFLGTIMGSRLLAMMPEKYFQLTLRWLITALAINLMLQAII